MALLVGVVWLSTLAAIANAQDTTVSQTCPSDQPWVDVETDAEVVMGAILNVHERGGGVFGCGNPSAKGVHYFEALRWAIKTLNKDSGYLNGQPTEESFIPGVKLGLRAYDSCTHQELAVRYMTELFPVLKSGTQACGTDEENATRIIGVIDATGNSHNPRISDAINEYLIPVIPLNQATTVPPEQLAKVLAEVVHDTNWERVAILHAEDEYSVFVTKIFGHIAFNGYPCIAAMKSLPSDITGAESLALQKTVSSLIHKLPDRTGIIVIAHGESLKALLKILGKLPQTSRLQWLFSWIPPSQELAEAFRQVRLSQVYSLSPFPNKISEFDDYWARLQDLASVENVADRWFLEYAMFKKGCRVAGYPGRQMVICDNLVVKEPSVDELLRVTRFLPAFHAVFTFAQAYKRAWSEKCLGARGVCRELRTMTRMEFVEKYLEPVEFDHQPEARSPINIRGQKTNTSVRGEVDGLQMALNEYTFSSSNGLEFKQVFAYDSREAKVLDENFRYMPSSCPTGGCKNCISVRQARLEQSDNDISPSEDFVTIARPEDILIPIILPLHQSGNNPMECGNVMNPNQVQNLEAALWTLDQINSDPEYLPGVRLGAVAIDSCSSPLTLTQRLSNYLIESQKKNPEDFLSSLAVITGGGPDEFNAAATVATPLNITLISTTDIIKSKDMKNTYLQTAPSMEYRLEAIAETLKFFEWTFISVIYDLDDKSQEQLNMFKEYSSNANLCFASEFAITSLDPVDMDYVTAQVIQAKNRGAKVMVLFTSDSTTMALLESLRRAYKAGLITELDFVIIYNGQWVNDFNNLKTFANQTFGGLLFKPEQGDVKDFEAFYRRLEPDGNKRNPWFVKLWNDAKQYQIAKSNLYIPTASTVNTIQAVLSVSAGLARLRNDLCHPDPGLCPRFFQQPNMRNLFHKYIHETASSKLDAEGDMFSFTKQGYANIPVDMLSFKTTSMNTFSYQKVSTFQNYTPNLTGSSVYGVAGQELPIDDISSECIHACPRCGKKTTDFLVLDSKDKLYLAAAMGVHESSSDRLSCGPVIPSPGIQTVEAFLWAVDQINNSPQILPGVTLGALVFDTCNSRERAARDVSNFLSDSLTSVNGVGGLPPNKNVLGFIATQSDDVIDSIVDVTMPSKLLTVATDATSSKFNDVEKYPALYRTTLPNDVTADGLVDILKHFRWNFVSVVYSEDDLGKADLFQVFKNEAERKNIDLATVVKLSASTITSTTAMRSLLLTLDAKREQGSNVVVLLLTSEHLATFFATIERQESSPIDDLVWIGVDNLETFHKYPEVSLGAIMLRPRTSTVTPFRQHFEDLSLQNNTRNPWFKEFWEQALKCRGASCYKEANLPKMPFLQHPSVPDVINSVLSIGVALESMRDGLCPGVARGICRTMREDPDFRNMLLNVSRTVSFMGVEGQLFKYTNRNYAAGTLEVYNFIQVGNNARAFVDVGKFSPDEGLSLNYSKVKAYNRHGHEFSLYEIKSECNNSEMCQKSSEENKVTVMQVPSKKEFAISAVMPIHKKGKNFFECGDLKDEKTFQNLGALTYAVNKINENEALLPGVNLGIVVFDYCGRKQRAEEQLYTFFSKDNIQNGQKKKVTPRSVIATLTYGDNVATDLSPILEASNIVQIAAPTDKMDFDDDNGVMHTVPPSMAQIQVLLSILNRFKWRYINLVYSNTDFGRASHYQFAKGTKQAEICLASVIRLDLEDTVDAIASKLRDNLETKEAKVVVLLVDNAKQINATIEAAKRKSLLHKFIWISSDGWGTNDQLAQSIRASAANVLTIQMEAKEEPEFLEYFADMTPRRHDPIPDSWFDEFWQRKFMCQLQDSSMPLTQFTKVCSGLEHLNIEDVEQDKYVFHTIGVVEAVAKGLHKYLMEKCPHGMAATAVDDCGANAQKELMLQVKKMISSRDSAECDECGPYGTMFGYDVFQLKSNDDDTSYSKVGNWKDGKLFIDEDQIKFTFGSMPKSVCRTHCETCTSQLGRPETLVDTRESIYDNFKEVWGITVSALSVLGMVLVIICALYFLMSFPVTVGTTVLGYMILFGLVLLYAVNFAFIIAPTEGTCGIRRFGLGLAYAVIFSGMLVKVMNTWRLMGYNGSRMLNDGTRLSSPAGLLVIAVGLVIIQIVLSAAWLILIPPKIGAYEMVWRCAPPTTFEEGLVVSLVYVMLLLAITTLFAIMTWQCQDNNKESRWILACSTLVAIVWLAWTILSTQISPHHRDLTIAAANLVNATIIMVCLYLRKVYLYSKLTRQAKDQDLKAHLQPSNYPHSLYGTSQKSGPFSTLAPVLYGSQASLNGKKLYNGPSSRLELINCPEDNKSDSSGSVQVQAADLYPLDMYDGGSQFQPVSSLFGSNHTLVLDDTLTFNR